MVIAVSKMTTTIRPLLSLIDYLFSIRQERVRYMVNELGIPPQNILCFTFTNKAAKEMQTRIHKVGGFDNVINVRTMHSFCVGFLRRWISVVRLVVESWG
eukprot:1324848-Amorphochlora_amoeboformis.AAC.2